MSLQYLFFSVIALAMVSVHTRKYNSVKKAIRSHRKIQLNVKINYSNKSRYKLFKHSACAVLKRSHLLAKWTHLIVHIMC